MAANTATTSRKEEEDMLSYEDVRKMDVKALRDRYGVDRGTGIELAGANHIAYVSSDMARTIWFWSEGLGLRLTKTIDLPNGGGQHFFLDAGIPNCSLAYFWFPNAPKPVPGVTSIDISNVNTSNFTTAHGGVNHVAWNVKPEKLREYRRRIKSLGVGFVSPILYHADYPEGYGVKKDDKTTWESFYFTGPDGEYMELTSQTPRPFTPEVDITHTPATIDDAEPPSKL